MLCPFLVFDVSQRLNNDLLSFEEDLKLKKQQLEIDRQKFKDEIERKKRGMFLSTKKLMYLLLNLIPA